MINCLTNYVTLSRVCDPTTPGSGLYLDEQFPIIRITSLASLTTQLNRTVETLMDLLVTRANRGFEDDVRAGMEGKFTRTDVVSGITSHEYKNPFALTSVGAERRGVYLEAGNSPYIDINIEQIQFYATGAGTYPITVHDANTGSLLDTISIVAAAAGYQTKQVDKTYSVGGKTRRLFISYDATATQSADTEELDGFGDSCYCDCSGDASDFVEAKGATIGTGLPIIESLLDKGSNSYGLIVTANVACSIGAFICKHKTAFRSAYLYRLLIEFMNEVKFSSRINELTIYNDREAIDEELFGNGPKVGIYDQYATMIKRVLDQIDPNDSTCFECDEPVMITTTIP